MSVPKQQSTNQQDILLNGNALYETVGGIQNWNVTDLNSPVQSDSVTLAGSPAGLATFRWDGIATACASDISCSFR